MGVVGGCGLGPGRVSEKVGAYEYMSGQDTWTIGPVHVIFLDFSKAFDSVPHQKLLLKTENIGVRGNLLRWIKSFLAGREQRVLIDGQSSDWTNVSSGVAQGSVLGPLLFLIYVWTLFVYKALC